MSFFSRRSFTGTLARASACAAALALAGCGSRSSLSLDGAPDGTTTVPPACPIALDPRPLPATAPGGLCTAKGGIPGSTMAAVSGRTLYGLSPAGATAQHTFLPDAPTTDVYEAARAVAVRGEWVFAADAISTYGEGVKETLAEVILGDRAGQVLATRSLSSESVGGFVSLRITGNDAGLMVYSFGAYPAVHTLEAMAPSGALIASVPDMDPITDPDSHGEVGVRATLILENRTYWLSLCTGETRETYESQRPVRTPPVTWGASLVYTDPSDGSLVVESAQGRKTLDLGGPSGDESPVLFDFHPSGWALLSTQKTLQFLAIHVGTGDKRILDLVLPQGYARYASFTGGPGPDQFDSNSRELRVTSAGGVLLPLRSAALGYLFTSTDGATWEALGAPIGHVFGAKGVESGGTFLHIGNAYSVTLPPWDPAPPGSGRIDYQSTQLIRPESGQSLVVLQSPMGEFYNDYYGLSADGGCLSTSHVTGPGVVWTSAVNGDSFSFPSPGSGTDSLAAALDWATDGDVSSASLLGI